MSVGTISDGTITGMHCTSNSDKKVLALFKGTADRDLVATKAKVMTAAENAAQGRIV